MDNNGQVRTTESGKISVQWRWIPAYGFRGWFLRRLGFAGITWPWRAIWILPEEWENEWLWRHELVHAQQVERDGAVWFSVRYLWWLVRYGYRNNPYEVEAYGVDR